MGLALSWSGGKDSSVALHELRQAGTEPDALLVTLTEPDEAVTIHRVPRPLVEAQARAVGLPLVRMHVPVPCPDGEYAARMRAVLEGPLADADRIAFGDLFLADIRAFREDRLAEAGRTAVFPLWGEPTRELARRVVAQGFRAVVCAVDTEQLPAEFLGRDFDDVFLDDLPDGVDHCGENGEFHTFVWDGPIFSAPVGFERGVHRVEGRFPSIDLHPGG